MKHFTIKSEVFFLQCKNMYVIIKNIKSRNKIISNKAKRREKSNMEERRKEALEIKTIARNKATKWTMFLILFEVLIVILVGILSGGWPFFNLMVLIVTLIVVQIVVDKLLMEFFFSEEISKRRNKRVEKIVPIEEYVEVIPIEGNSNWELIQKLRKIAKVYAVRKEKKQTIEIEIKFDGEAEMYHFETLPKSMFEDNYCMIERNE